MKKILFKKWLHSSSTQTMLSTLYKNESLPFQKKRYLSMFDAYETYFPHAEDVDVFSSPGRVEVCGNHTDHQLGQVIAMAIDLDTVGFTKKNNDQVIRIYSKGYDDFALSLNDLNTNTSEYHTPIAMVRGIAHYFKVANNCIGGFDAYIESTILSGSGVSSSASFEILITKILDHYYGANSLSLTDYAIISQKAENNYFQKPCGLMDQLVIAHGGICHIDFFNSQKPYIQKINGLRIFSEMDICIVQSGGSHSDLSHDYSEIFSDCNTLANFFNETYLSRVKVEDFYSSLNKLYEQLDTRIIMRGFHFFKETERVKQGLNALKTNDLPLFLETIISSGQSSYQYLQNVINKHSSKQGLALALLIAEHSLKSKGAWRVHGGGFAGTILLFTPKNMTNNLKEQYESIYKQNSFIKVYPRQEGVFCLTK